jgi:ketosteroid isomerase-like protein
MEVTGTQVVQGFVVALARGELDDCLELVADGIVFSEARSLPFGGDWTGKQGVRDLFAAVARQYRVRLGPPQVLGGGIGGVVRMSGRITGRATGIQLPLDCLDLYQVEHGLISRVDVFYKDATAVAALAADPRAAAPRAVNPGAPNPGGPALAAEKA